jgi:hypothetical protein
MPLERAGVAATGSGYRSHAAPLTLATAQPAAGSEAEGPPPGYFIPPAHPETVAYTPADALPIQRAGRPLPPLPTRHAPPPPPVPPAAAIVPPPVADSADSDEGAPSLDLDALARDVLPRIKRLLAIERERRPMW